MPEFWSRQCPSKNSTCRIAGKAVVNIGASQRECVSHSSSLVRAACGTEMTDRPGGVSAGQELSNDVKWRAKEEHDPIGYRRLLQLLFGQGGKGASGDYRV